MRGSLAQSPPPWVVIQKRRTMGRYSLYKCTRTLIGEYLRTGWTPCSAFEAPPMRT